MVASHHCSSPSGQMVTSGYQVLSPCCHHAHPHMSHQQHISTPSHCQSCHPVRNVGHNSQDCCHDHGDFSHHEHRHHPVFASPLHISHSHTTPPGNQRLQCDGGIHDPACHSHQFLTPQPQHSQTFYQNQRQSPFLPHFHAGVSTPTHPHRKLLQQSPLSSYARPLPATPEQQANRQLEFSSPLGEDGMVLSTKLVPSCFLLAHPTALCRGSQPMEDQHFHSQNAASQVQTLVGSPRVLSMHQLQSQDLASAGEVNQNASISTLQQSQRRNKSRLPASETALFHPPTVVVQKLPASVLPKREASLTLSTIEDPLAYPEREQTTVEEEESLGDSEKYHKRRKKERVSCEQVYECCTQQIGGVEVEEAVLDVPAENEAVLEDALLTQPTSTNVPPKSGSVSDIRVQVRSRTESNTKAAPRRSSRLRYLTDTDDSQSEQDVRSRMESNTKAAPRRSSRLRYLTDTDDSQSEQDVRSRMESTTKAALRRSSRLRYLTDTDSQSEQDVGDMQSTVVRPVKMRKKKERVRCEQVDDHCPQQIRGVEVEEAVLGGLAEDEAILEDALFTQPTGTKDPPCGKDSRKKGKGSVVLSNWYFKVAVVSESCCMVILLGTKTDDNLHMLWHSGPIVKRSSPRELATKSGTVYCLKGPLDQAALAAAGINDAEIAQSFRNGFPKNWLQLIEKQALGGKRVMDKTEDVAVIPAVGKKTLGGGGVKVKSEPKKPKTPDLDLSVANSCFVSSLKRSSRGRTIKPSVFNMSPYINLTNEVYSYDWYGSFQGVSSPVIDLTLCDMSHSPKKTKRQVKKEKDSEDCLPTKKERKSQKQEPDVWEDGSPLLTAERGDSAAPLKSTVSRNYSTDSCSRCTPLSLRKRRVRQVVTKTETTKTYDDTVEDGQTGEEEEAVVRVEVNTRKSVQCAQKRKDKGGRMLPKSQTCLLSSSENVCEIESMRYAQKCKDKGGRMLLKSRTHLLSSSESESESDGVESVRYAPKCKDNGGRISLKSQLSPSESECEIGSAELTKPTQLELRGANNVNRRDRITQQPATKRTQLELRGANNVNRRDRITRQPATKRTKQSRVNTSRPSSQDSANQQTRKNASGTGRRKAAHKLSASQSGPQYSEWTMGDGKEVDEGISWSATDVEDLKSIVHAVPAMTTNFWERVARQLGTGHSARECSHQYQQLTVRPSRRKHPQEKPTNVKTSGPTAITGRVGTMKRKRQIRDALEQMDRGYTDDIFESTPFKKKLKRVQLQGLSDDQSSDEEAGVESQPIQTPSEAKRRLGAPSSFTPKLCSYLTTPDLKGGMKREAADNVMFKIQKAKKGKRPKQPTKPGAPLGKTKPLLFEQRLRNIRTGETTTLRMFEDSDDSGSDSNPFSDIEENYRDIISRLH